MNTRVTRLCDALSPLGIEDREQVVTRLIEALADDVDDVTWARALRTAVAFDPPRSLTTA